jgi:hypothetical protein
MTMWLYQMNQKLWEPQRYRVEIWEGERWSWSVGRTVGATKEPPRPGDTVVFFYAPAGGHDPGFYGWAVITEWLPEHDEMYFRPVAPSDHLKMHPWGDEEADELANQIRGKVKRGNLWRVSENLSVSLRQGITRWVSGQTPRQ